MKREYERKVEEKFNGDMNTVHRLGLRGITGGTKVQVVTAVLNRAPCETAYVLHDDKTTLKRIITILYRTPTSVCASWQVLKALVLI